MSWKNIVTIAQKDWIEVRQNKAASMPMLVLPLVFIVILPAILLGSIQFVPGGADTMLNDPDMAGFMNKLPGFINAQIAGFNDVQSGIFLMLGYFFAPFFLMLPLMFATIVASESFAGEYERKTIEALLYTPASDAELFLGKVLAAGVPSLLITWGSFVLYGVVVNSLGWPIMQRIWFPIPTWWVLIFWVAPAISLLGISFTVLISARTRTFMGAYQSSASLVIVVLGLLVGQATGLLYLSVGIGLLIGLVLWLIAAGLTYLAVKGFNRTRLLAAGD